jgi:hypothetical protein
LRAVEIVIADTAEFAGIDGLIDETADFFAEACTEQCIGEIVRAGDPERFGAGIGILRVDGTPPDAASSL